MNITASVFDMWSPLLITAFLAVIALYILNERQLIKKIRKKYDAEFIREISKAQRRSYIIIFIVTSALFIIIAMYDLQLRKLDEQLATLEEVISINAQIDTEQKTVREVQNDDIIDGSAEDKDYYPPVIENNDIVEPAPVELKSPNSIQDIFGGNNSSKSISDIKTRYEELLATYLLMEKCGKIGQNDYSVIIISLQKEMNAIQAPARLQDDTLTAAKGSYEELYSQSDCSKPSIKDTEQQYNSYIQSLSRRLQQ